MRLIGRIWLATGLVSGLGLGAAWAQGAPPAACFQQCAAPSMSLAANPAPVQACLVRCRAARDFSAQQHRPSGRPQQIASANPYSSGRGTPVAAPAQASVANWGAIYAALPPTAAVGISSGARDRGMVHVQAESQCRASAHGDCRLLTEFSSGCGAAAQAVRSLSVVPSAHPSTFRVTYVASGTGANRADAERAALANCSSRDPVASCRIVTAACVNG
jgi:hypothetical protein